MKRPSVAILCGLLIVASTARAESDRPVRIVTFAPALTQMMIDLNLADALVGVSEHDEAAPQHLPIVGNFVDPNTEKLIAARPTHVLMMSGKAGPPARLEDLADDGLFKLVAYPYPATVDAVSRTLIEVGRLLDREAQAEALRDAMIAKLDSIRERTAEFGAPRVLLVFGTGPVWASGPGTVNDVLLDYVGARNAAADANIMAPTYDREGLIALRPDVILLLMPDAPPLEPDDSRLAEFAGLPIPAVRNERIHLINDPQVLLPTTTLPRIAEQMAAAIHPEYDPHDDAASADQPGE